MCNFFFRLLLTFLISTSVVTAEDDEAFVVETLGKISKKTVTVYSAPDESSKKLYKLAKDNKVVVLSEVDENWLKVKFGITKTGYIRKDSIDFVSTLKKEIVRGSYHLTKLNLDINALVERFNINFTESAYFQQEGLVPQIKLLGLKNKKDTLEADILYDYAGEVSGDSAKEILNPFHSETLSIMEVIFFKMFLMEKNIYKINIFKNDSGDDKKSVVNYCYFEYKYAPELFEHIKGGSGRIFQYVESSMNLKDVFKYYP